MYRTISPLSKVQVKNGRMAIGLGGLLSAILASGAYGAMAGGKAFITPITVTASSDQGASVSHLIDGSGLSETGPGSGVFVHFNVKYLNNSSTMWNAAYPGGNADYNAWVVFDLGKQFSVKGLHVWNYNENGAGGDFTFRGFKEVEVSSSNDGKAVTD